MKGNISEANNMVRCLKIRHVFPVMILSATSPSYNF